jgi:hypothetical protein
MKVEFADSFWKSLKRLSTHQTWWYKTYEVFRYKIPMFLENLWYFRKELWSFRSWDYSFNLKLLSRSLEKTANTLEFYGNEIEITRLKKVVKIKRVIEIIKNLDESNYISKAENELGKLKNSDWLWNNIEDTDEEREHNRKVFDLSNKIEIDEWNELWTILKGQNHDEFKKIYESSSDEEKHNQDLWNNWFDGSGIKHWWD